MFAYNPGEAGCPTISDLFLNRVGEEETDELHVHISAGKVVWHRDESNGYAGNCTIDKEFRIIVMNICCSGLLVNPGQASSGFWVRTRSEV